MKRPLILLLAACPTAVASCADIVGIADVPDGPVDVSTGDGGLDAGPMCDPSTPFGTPDLVVSLPTTNVVGITLSPDQLIAFVAEALPGTYHPQLYAVTRATTASAFGTGTLLLDNAGSGSVASDGTFVWSYGLTPDSGGIAVFHLHRGILTGSGASLSVTGDTSLTGLNMTGEQAPFILADGTELFYSGGTPVRVYQADSGFEAATAVTDLGINPYNAVLTPDGLVIYFARAGDVAVASRSAQSDPFSNATVVIHATGGAQLTPAFISADRCTLYFSSQTSTTANDGSPTSTSLTYMALKTP